jgi:hypothetical protein
LQVKSVTKKSLKTFYITELNIYRGGGNAMIKRLHAVFDGKVLIPTEAVDLEVGEHCELLIEKGPSRKVASEDIEKDPAFNLSELSVRTNIPDLAAEHDHYLYGIPKRQSDD